MDTDKHISTSTRSAENPIALEEKNPLLLSKLLTVCDYFIKNTSDCSCSIVIYRFNHITISWYLLAIFVLIYLNILPPKP